MPVKKFSKDNQPAGAAATRFQKGQSGNPGGQWALKPFREALMRALAEKAANGNATKLDQVVMSLITAAINGNTDAIGVIAERLDGKVIAVQHTGDPDNPIAARVQIEHTFRSSI
jgi:hypothetical protein